MDDFRSFLKQKNEESDQLKMDRLDNENKWKDDLATTFALIDSWLDDYKESGLTVNIDLINHEMQISFLNKQFNLKADIAQIHDCNRINNQLKVILDATSDENDVTTDQSIRLRNDKLLWSKKSLSMLGQPQTTGKPLDETYFLELLKLAFANAS